MSNRPSAEKIKKSQALWKIVSEFIQSESPFERIVCRGVKTPPAPFRVTPPFLKIQEHYKKDKNIKQNVCYNYQHE